MRINILKSSISARILDFFNHPFAQAMLCGFLLSACAATLRADAVGDERHPTQPTFPTVCSVQYAALDNVNGEPSSETAFDTLRIQNALNSCAPGQALELSYTNSTESAYLLQPIHIPSGVTLQIDAGVTVFASRNPQDYQEPGIQYPHPGWTVYGCGTNAPVNTVPNGCFPLITTGVSMLASPTSGSGIIGYGVVDGRGGDALVDDNGKPLANPYPATCKVFSWWCLTQSAYLPGTNTQVATENSPMLVNPYGASNFTLFMISLVHAPYFYVRWQGQAYTAATSGFTAWGVKIVGPYNVSNTDGIDPVDNMKDVSIVDTYISTGDDDIAITANQAGYEVKNISILDVYTYAGDGVAIGTGLQGGVRNVLVDGLYQNGLPNAPAGGQGGLKIKSLPSIGGLVRDVTFQNVCMQNQTYAIQLYPTDGGGTGGSPPIFGTSTYPIVFENVTVGANSSGEPGYVQFLGTPGYPSYVTLDNVDIEGNPTIEAEDVYIHLGPGEVSSAGSSPSLEALTGSGVYYTGSAGGGTPYACSAWSYPQLVGQLFLSTGTRVATQTNLGQLTVKPNTKFTLNTVLEPTTYESPSLVAVPVSFYEGSKQIGTATLEANGTLARFSISNATVGTHTYTAGYTGNSSYRPYYFGSVTVNVAP